ncbi:MAG: NFACT family protein [Nitrospinae bacterium]|nr:NFACT family protein [Nitrospinota bacterium]
MSLKIDEIAKIISEIKNPIKGGKVQKIYQPSEYSLTLEIWTGNKNILLYISIEPHLSRIHLITEKYPNPPEPYPFCMFLRKHLTGARIDEISRIQDDRVIIIRLSKNVVADVNVENKKYNLIAELTGRIGNIILTDGDMKILMTALKQETKEREMKAGGIYMPPSSSLSPSHLPLEKEQTGGFLNEDDTPFNVEVEKRYRTIEIERLRNEVTTGIRQKIKKLERKLEALDSDLKKVEKYKEDNIKGELLKANFNLIKKGMEIITLKDYYQQSEDSLLTVELDPSLSPSQNIEKCFKRHKKYIRGREEILKHIEVTKKEIAQLHRKIDETMRHGSEILRSAQNDKRRTHNEKSKGARNDKKRQSARQSQDKSSPMSFESIDGLTILVGKNNKQNDELTFKIAKGNDIWLHVRDFPGSHVVIQTGKRKDVPRETLLDAASLAICFSKLKSTSRGNIVYTFKKYVKKPKWAEAGKVIISQDKNIFVTIDPKRIDRLFKNNSHEI